jgi:hypothetical protein
MATDLVRRPDDDDDEEEAPRPRSKYFADARPNYVIPGPNAATPPPDVMPTIPGRGSERMPPPAPDVTGTLPSVSTTMPPPNPPPPHTTLAQGLEERRETLNQKLNPPRETGWRRFGQVAGTIGQDIGAAIRPDIMERIPGTTMNRREELARIDQLLSEEQARQATAATEGRRTDIEQQKTDIERQKAGLPHMLPPGQETVRTSTADGHRENLWEIPGQPAQWVPEGGYPETARPLPPAGIPTGTGTLGQQRTPPPPPPEGTLPRTQPPTAPPLATPPVTPAYTYGKPAEGQIPLRDDERKQANDEAASFWQRLNKGTAVPPAYQLRPGATKEDAARMMEMLKAEQSAAGTQAQRAETNQRAQVEQNRKDEVAAGKWVRAIDNDGKMHYMSRGDYDAHARDFHPHPAELAPGAYEKANDHNTILNEMQGRLNAAAESAQNFNWKDRGQRELVMQGMANLEQGWADKVIGIPAIDFLAQHIRQWGLEGATPETREYLIDLIALREAMLGMPKEITSGSRMMEKAIEALYATLPSGVTPDLKYALTQMRASQGIMDRLRGSRVPIIDGMITIPKVPILYQHSLQNPKTKEEIFSDDGKKWFDENNMPITGPKR